MHLRLIVQLEIAAHDCGPQRLLQFQGVQAAAHVGSKAPQGVAPAGLGAVHGRVGVFA